MKRPRNPAEWEQRYQTGELPWDHGRVDPVLQLTVGDHPIAPGRAFEVGCGTGTNAVWLAQQGFEVEATDYSATAIGAASAKAKAAGVEVRFTEGSFPSGADPFDLAFDRGCFHCVDDPAARGEFAASLAGLLQPEGLWLSLIGSTDGPPRDHGPPRVSAAEVMAAVEPHFEILSLENTMFDGDLPSPARMWICLMQRRSEY